jgi:hypothetical protein
LAATLDPATGEAVLLDRRAVGQLEQVRFFRLDLTTGVARMIVSYPTTRAFDQYHLVSGDNGTFTLAASRAAGQGEYRLVRFRLPRTAGPPQVGQRLVVAGRTIRQPPMADGMGVTVVEPSGTSWAPVGRRWLDFTQASASDLAGLF